MASVFLGINDRTFTYESTAGRAEHVGAKPLSQSVIDAGEQITPTEGGKTANFTALIAKAADSGFDLFVVLSGMYNDLRQQTQMRLDRELVGDSTETDEPHVDGTGFTKRWKKETSDRRFLVSFSLF